MKDFVQIDVGLHVDCCLEIVQAVLPLKGDMLKEKFIDLFPANCCNDIHLSTVSCSKAATPNIRHFGGIGQL